MRGYRGRCHQTDAGEYATRDAAPLRHCRTFMPGKETAPQSAQCERDHGDGGALDDAADSGPKWVEVAVVGNLALRENNHQIALLQRFGDLIIGSLERLRVFTCGRNRNCASGAKDEVEHGNLEN